MHEIVTIVKNGMPAPYQLDVTVRTTVHGNADEYFDHLEAVMAACGFHKDTFENTIAEIANEMNEGHDRETFSLLARAQETLSKSPLRSDNALAAEILEMLVGPGEELEDEDVAILGGEYSVDLGPQPEDAFPFALPDEDCWGKGIGEQIKAAHPLAPKQCEPIKEVPWLSPVKAAQEMQREALHVDPCEVLEVTLLKSHTLPNGGVVYSVMVIPAEENLGGLLVTE